MHYAIFLFSSFHEIFFTENVTNTESKDDCKCGIVGVKKNIHLSELNEIMKNFSKCNCLSIRVPNPESPKSRAPSCHDIPKRKVKSRRLAKLQDRCKSQGFRNSAVEVFVLPGDGGESLGNWCPMCRGSLVI
jgi:hypothetical protein